MNACEVWAGKMFPVGRRPPNARVSGESEWGRDVELANDSASAKQLDLTSAAPFWPGRVRGTLIERPRPLLRRHRVSDVDTITPHPQPPGLHSMRPIELSNSSVIVVRPVMRTTHPAPLIEQTGLRTTRSRRQHRHRLRKFQDDRLVTHEGVCSNLKGNTEDR
jgi:hypothetical protein